MRLKPVKTKLTPKNARFYKRLEMNRSDGAISHQLIENKYIGGDDLVHFHPLANMTIQNQGPNNTSIVKVVAALYFVSGDRFFWYNAKIVSQLDANAQEVIMNQLLNFYINLPQNFKSVYLLETSF